MRRIYLISVALLLPAALFADVSVSVRVGSGHSGCHHAEEVYKDYGDPWFEECESSWPNRVSFEYQWTLHGPGHVLRYREVRFHLLSGAWFFGPWMVKENYCHPSCTFHHHHVFYKHHSHPDWCRVYDHSAGIFYYEYRNRHHPGIPAKVHRHEYRPAIKVTERVYETRTLPKRSSSADLNKNKDRKVYRQSNFTAQKGPERKIQTVPKKVESSVNRSTRTRTGEPASKEKSRDNQNNRIVRISGRR